MKVKLLAMVVILTLMLGGCAKKPYVNDPKKSYALNIMKAVGPCPNLRDNKPLPKDTTLAEAAIAGGLGAASSMSTLLNISSGLAGGFSAIDNLLMSKKGFETSNFIFAWTDRKTLSPVAAKTEVKEEARVKARAAITEAFDAVIKDFNWPPGYSVTEDPSGGGYIRSVIGGRCTTEYQCGYSLLLRGGVPIR